MAKNILGGAAIYTSIIASLLGSRVGLVSRIGHDFSKQFISFIKNKGVDTQGLKKCTGLSTKIKLIYDEENLKSINIFEGVSSGIIAEDFPKKYESTKLVHLTTAPLKTQVELTSKLKKKGISISFDPHSDLNNVDFFFN